MKKEEVLDKAKELITNDRIKAYGPPKMNFQRIATLWEPILKTKVSPAQIALCLTQLKVARLIETEDHNDSWVDLAGYAACGGEVSEKEPEQLTQTEIVRMYEERWNLNSTTAKDFVEKRRKINEDVNPNMWGVN